MVPTCNMLIKTATFSGGGGCFTCFGPFPEATPSTPFLSHSTCRRLRLRINSAIFCFQENHTFLKREVPGRARHYSCARGGGGVCKHGVSVTPNTLPTSGLACALHSLQSVQDSGVALCCHGNQTRTRERQRVRAERRTTDV